ncbi:hypothetical protein D3C72_1712670 [compost metagenome]
MVRGAAPDGGRQDIQRAQVAFERARKFGSDIPGRLAAAGAARLDLVVAAVRIRRQMTDVRDVHHVAHLQAVEFERAAQAVDEQIGAQVADMRVVVDRGPAGVQARLARGDGLEGPQAAAIRVVQMKCHAGLSCALRKKKMATGFSTLWPSE